jgi:iron complex outermembrane receptor protein
MRVRGILLLTVGFLVLQALCPDPRFAAEVEQHVHAHEHVHGDEHEPEETIVVTATPLVHQRDELATAVNRLDRGAIIRNLRNSLGETVGKLPGVSSTGFTAGASRPVIRGQDAFRTEVLDTGLSTQDVSRLSPDHAIPVSPLAAQAIEVVRGPGVLRYGGGASGGVVNAVTNRVPQTRFAAPVQAEALGTYQQNGRGGEFGAVLEGYVEDFAWHLDGLFQKAQDYETGAGESQKGTDTETWSATAGSAYFFEESRLGVAYTRFESAYGIPEITPVDIDMHTDRYRFEGDWDRPVKGLREVQVRGVYSQYRHKEISDGVLGQSFHNDEFEGRLEAIHESAYGFFGALGLHGRQQTLRAGGEAEEFLAPSETASFAAYVFEERALSLALDVEFGLRIEGVWVEGTPISGRKRQRSFAPISGSAALLFHSDTLTLALTGAASQRAPSQVELFARGPHEATGTFEIGNPKFDEETSYNGELRLESDLEHVRFELNAFATYYVGYIFGQLAGVQVDEDGEPDPSGEFELLSYRERRAIFYGGEIVVGIDLIETLDGVLGTEWQLDYVRARFTDGSGNRNIPRIPPMRWGGSLFYEHHPWRARVGFLRHEAQWSPAADEFATSAYTVLDFSVGWLFYPLEGYPPLELTLAASNLLDEEARNAVSFTKSEVSLPGRGFRVNVHLSF